MCTRSLLILMCIPWIFAVRLDFDKACSSNCDDKSCPIDRTCPRLIRDHCQCCWHCLRHENESCGNVTDRCADDLLCYPSMNQSSSGICLRACIKLQCLWRTTMNRSYCECAHRRVPCHLKPEQSCDVEETIQLKSPRDHSSTIDCSNVTCPNRSQTLSTCPSDSHWVSDPSSPQCCGQCVCSTCPKMICGENAILQISRTANRHQPGRCCDEFSCIANSKQCYHDKKIYQENETWSIDPCTTCTCQGGFIDCQMVQCPVYSHCGYMYKPENECCPKCGGCLNDRFHVQHMNSTWIESNGCMKCWCENGRSRCVAEGCIAPPCENPRQIANICCPVCDVDEDPSSALDPLVHSSSRSCPPLNDCSLNCEYGLVKDDRGCFQCLCSSLTCPSPYCTLKFDRLTRKEFCSCSANDDRSCPPFNCDKHCPYNYTIDERSGCPSCTCNPCPPLMCTKNCTYGLKRNEIGCPLCVCESRSINRTEEIFPSWSRQCQSGDYSYSNGEIWFDGCRQCLCYKGQTLCALISCPVPKCPRPIFRANQCCPSCPDSSLYPSPIPSSQVCYTSQSVTGEELQFDKCTKCICLHNMAFCSISLCPPLSCSQPIYDATLCCPICPRSSLELTVETNDETDEDFCLLDNGLIKRTGEVWKEDDCRSCLCPKNNAGRIECFSEECPQTLPCANPVLKKGQCCPFCLPSTAAVAVCIFNYIQYRSGEHWNVSECHHCQCILGTIVCHQHQCPLLTCVHTVTLAGHCCPICRDQLPWNANSHHVSISPSGLSLSIITLFLILISILSVIILILLCCLCRVRHRSISSTVEHPSSSMINHTKLPHLFPYRYDFHSHQPIAISSSSSSHFPLTSLEQISTHSMLGTNTTGTISSRQELEPIPWPDEDDTLMLQCSTSSHDDDDDDDQADLTSNDEHEESRPQLQLIPATSTIIYV